MGSNTLGNSCMQIIEAVLQALQSTKEGEGRRTAKKIRFMYSLFPEIQLHGLVRAHRYMNVGTGNEAAQFPFKFSVQCLCRAVEARIEDE